MTYVNNPYRSAIVSEKTTSQPDAQTLSDGLNSVVFHFQNAWTGGTAPQVLARLQALASSGAAASGNANQAFDDAIARQPRTVDTHAWQLHWKNLVR